MADATAPEEWQERRLKDWSLAILRFAVTLEPADKAAILAIADELDRLGWRTESPPTFAFFGRTSASLCEAIAHKDDSARAAILRLHLKRVDDRRLRRALEAAIDLVDCTPISAAPRQKNRDRSDLWKGLRHR